jgi:hypothetical protein
VPKNNLQGHSTLRANKNNAHKALVKEKMHHQLEICVIGSEARLVAVCTAVEYSTQSLLEIDKALHSRPRTMIQ